MGVIHKFTGDGQTNFDWDGQRFFDYGARPDVSDGATVRWLIGAAEAAPNFALRYFEIQPGGHSAAEEHPYEHGVMVLCGQAKVILNGAEHEVGVNDVVYIYPDEPHQFINTSSTDPFGFLCIVPAHRVKKSGKRVYAESDIFPVFKKEGS